MTMRVEWEEERGSLVDECRQTVNREQAEKTPRDQLGALSSWLSFSSGTNARGLLFCLRPFEPFAAQVRFRVTSLARYTPSYTLVPASHAS